MTQPARSVTVTLRGAPRGRAAKPEATVEERLVLRIADEDREYVAETLAALLLAALADDEHHGQAQ